MKKKGVEKGKITQKKSLLYLSRSSVIGDAIVDYRILIDDDFIDFISNGEKKKIPIKPGKHKIQLKKMKLHKSDIIEFNVRKGDNVFFNCGSKRYGWRVYLWLFWPPLWRYDLPPYKDIWIKQVPSISTPIEE